MEEIRSGIRHALALPWLYDTFQKVVGAYAWRDRVLQKFVTKSIPPNGKLIDIGCGTAEAVKFLPKGVEYIGFDRNPDYIKKAQQRFGHLNAVFHCEELSTSYLVKGSPADVVLALGIIHHLDDAQTINLLKLAKKLLGKSGFLLTLDPVFDSQQSSFAKYIISKDRGTAVRMELAYKELALQVFSRVEVFVDPDPLYVPYTGIVMKCYFD